MKLRISVTIGVLLLLGAAASGQDAGYGPVWWAPGEGRVFPRSADYMNSEGALRVVLDGGDMPTANHAFFTPHGPDGRACVSCHQPSDGMSLSAETAQTRWTATGGKDPLFAAYDGSNCPLLPQGDVASHSLILSKGLIRVQRPWPPKEWNGQPVHVDFKIEVMRDPTGCNSGKGYGPAAGNISVYRRPRQVANLKYVAEAGFPYDPKEGMALRRAANGEWLAGNLMADGRDDTLDLQMADAAATHLRMTTGLTNAERAQILDFEKRIYVAQTVGKNGVRLDSLGATGGPEALERGEGARLGSIGKVVWSEFAPWESDSQDARAGTPAETAYRQSVARGARLFREKTFLIDNSAGINSPMGFGNPTRNACVLCHNMSQTGLDVAPGQVDIGTTNEPYMNAAPDLPLFRITCLEAPHRHYGKIIYTTDPGFALSTGRCADVGRVTIQSMRGLSARAPYFSNGSAKDTGEIIDYYDRRYHIGYTAQERQDLINLLNSL